MRCIFSTFLISRLSSILINWLWTCFKYEKSYIFRFSLLSSIVQFIVSGHFMHCLIMCYPMTKNITIVFKTTEKKTCVKLFKAIKYSRMASHTQNSRYYFHFYSHFRKKANTNRKWTFFFSQRSLSFTWIWCDPKNKNTHSVERQRELRYDIYIYEGEWACDRRPPCMHSQEPFGQCMKGCCCTLSAAWMIFPSSCTTITFTIQVSDNGKILTARTTFAV